MELRHVGLDHHDHLRSSTFIWNRYTSGIALLLERLLQHLVHPLWTLGQSVALALALALTLALALALVLALALALALATHVIQHVVNCLDVKRARVSKQSYTKG